MKNEWKRRIQKPIGVYILTIVIFLGLGLLQFIRYLDFFNQADGDVPFPIVFISLFLCGFTAASAIWAFFGDNTGRVALLTFVSLNVLWAVFLAVMEISYANASDSRAIMLSVSLIKPLVWLGVYWWYFTKKDVVAYYKQNS